MSAAAKLFIDAIIAIGVVVIGGSAAQWHTEHLFPYAVFVGLALLGSALKVRLPGITGTYSLAFCFVLIAIFNFSLPQVVMLGAASAAVQCLCRPKHRPSPRSVLFSICSVAISAIVAGVVHQSVESFGNVATFVLTPTVYWIINTGLVSAALTMVSEGTLSTIWQRWCVGTLPYYLLGAVLAIAVSSSIHTGQWHVSLFILPTLGLLYVYWRLTIASQTPTAEPSASLRREVLWK